jgi:serine acetyltransferase
MAYEQVLSSAIGEFIRSDKGSLLLEDTLAWARWYSVEKNYFADGPVPIDFSNAEYHINICFSRYREFRNLVDYRINTASVKLAVPWGSSWARVPELHINCPEIGPRFRIQHGQNTYVFAKKIGADFLVNHNVTIGFHRGIPMIGDCVSIRTGAVVLGSIRIGSNVMIGANATVTVDVPDNHNAYPARTAIVPKRIISQ